MRRRLTPHRSSIIRAALTRGVRFSPLVFCCASGRFGPRVVSIWQLSVTILLISTADVDEDHAPQIALVTSVRRMRRIEPCRTAVPPLAVHYCGRRQLHHSCRLVYSLQPCHQDVNRANPPVLVRSLASLNRTLATTRSYLARSVSDSDFRRILRSPPALPLKLRVSRSSLPDIEDLRHSSPASFLTVTPPGL
jgi:hypothetical protein